MLQLQLPPAFPGAITMRAHHLLLPLTPLGIPQSHPMPKIHRPFLCYSSPLALRFSSVRALLEAESDEIVQSGDAETTGEGPIEIQISPFSSSNIFATSDDPTPLQVATSLLLTGSISIFLFRSLRRRVRRAMDLRVRSAGVKETKNIKVEALESLKDITSQSLDNGKPPSPLQALLGSLAAGAITLILYKFATTVEASLNRQTISDNFSVQQITITIRCVRVCVCVLRSCLVFYRFVIYRTIVNGLCYLATFVFGINSIGLFLYSGQLLFNSLMRPESDVNSSSPSEEALKTTPLISSSERTETKDGENRSNET